MSDRERPPRVKRSRLLQRLLVIALVMGVAALAWKLGLVPIAHPKCEPMKLEQRDASGKVVRIFSRTCVAG